MYDCIKFRSVTGVETLVVLCLSLGLNVFGKEADSSDYPETRAEQRMEWQESNAEKQAPKRIEREKTKFRSRAKSVIAFCNGSVSIHTLNNFWASYRMTSLTPAIAVHLEAHVPAISARDFRVAKKFGPSNLICSDGCLDMRPIRKACMELLKPDHVEAASTHVKNQWTEIVGVIRADKVISNDSILTFRNSVDVLSGELEKHRSTTPQPNLNLAIRHCKSLTMLSLRLCDEEFLCKLGWCVGLHSFPGGSMADLLDFLDGQPVAPNPKTDGALALGRLAYEINRQGAITVGVEVPQGAGNILPHEPKSETYRSAGRSK